MRRTSKNAVDLRIAEALGQAHETYGGETGFTVVSGDQDFDAVLAHLAIELGRCARRTSEVRPRMSSPARSTNPKRFRDDFFGPDIDHVHIVDHSGDNPRVRPDTLPGDDWRAIVFGHEDVSTGDPWKAAGMFERARFVGLRGSRKHTREFFLALYLGRLHAACDDDVRFTLHSDTDLLDELITSYWERRRLVSRAAPPRKPQKKRAPRKRMTTLERWDHEEGGVVNECFARGRLKNWFRGQPYRKKKTNEALADLRRHGRII